MKPCTCTTYCQGLLSLEAEGVGVEEVYCALDPPEETEAPYEPWLYDPKA